jgi:hypothetical protein
MIDRLRELDSAATPCIEWTGARDRYGYGMRRWNGRTTRAHRVAWEQANGPIPAGLSVLHRCDNPPCINVDHLYAGTHQDNMRDRGLRGRTQRANALKTHCRNGHPYDEVNTRTHKGKRYCRVCQRERMSIRYHAGLDPRYPKATVGAGS